ncbi:MAG TPA: PadR family transcriptional regulator [Candidatus Thermoplasmatota archaeon]|nr:PadR family transcriptional regulator [Candidatus Thermoplasmatota archaeon]
MADAGAKVLRGLLDVFLLESLEREPKHGYALLREMADAFGTEPNRNRLYPLLGRMVRDGLVVERSDAAGGRTLYALTEAGHLALEGYRDLPAQFKERLARVWSAAAARPAAPTAAPRAAPARVTTIPVEAPLGPAAAEGAPYPCPDARVALEKNPRTGDLSLRLTGCPIGAYDYCPLCPISKSLEGLRRITLG